MAPILAYWDIRGMTSPIRMLLAHADVRYEDKRYPITEAGMDEWFKQDKPALKGTLDFPNLPYYIDGMVQISQSKAILQYLGKKHGLYGTNDQELTRMWLITEEVGDMKQTIVKIAHPPASASNRTEVHEAMKKEYLEKLEDKLDGLSRFLGDNDWMAGNKLTYVDFFVYDVLDWNRTLWKTKYIEKFGNLAKFMDRIESLKGVKEYLGDKEKFERLPMFSPFAMIGQSKDYQPTD